MKKINILIALVYLAIPGILKSQCKLDSVTSYEIDLNTNQQYPMITSKNIYGINDTLKGEIGHLWDKNTQKWGLFSKRSYEYNTIGKLKRSYTQTWVSSAWVNGVKQDNTYDANGNLILLQAYNWNSVSSIYENNYKNTSVFNGTNQETQSITQNWDKTLNNWINVSKNDYNYTGNTISLQYMSIWNKDSAKWLNALKLVNNLDGNNRITKQLVDRWECDGSGCKWVYNSYADYLKDKNNRDTAIYFYDLVNGLYNVQQTAYNSDGCVIADKTYQKDPGFPLQLMDGSDYVYYKNASSVGVLDAVKFSVYPIPSSEYIVVENSPETFYRIADAVSGKIVRTGELMSNTDKLDVSALQNGLYFLNIGNRVTKIIVNH